MSHADFDRRVRRLNKKHSRMSRGVVTSVTHDGLIVARPRVGAPRFPVKAIVIMIAVFFAFKGILMAQMGAAAYEDKVAMLQQGNDVEKAGAWVMQVDPVTVWLSERIQPYLN